MRNFIGTEKQVKFANQLINEFLEPLQKKNELMESRGLETFSEKHIARYFQNKTWIEAVNSMNVENASNIIGLFTSMRSGNISLENFKKTTNQ
jgi:hypothetical protein